MPLPVALFVPGVLTASFDRGLTFSPEMMLPSTSWTKYLTVQLVGETIVPVGAGETPLSMISCAPGGTAGRVKLLVKFAQR